MPLKGGDVWSGLDRLRIEDEKTGEIISDEFIVVGMDVCPNENRIIFSVSSDISDQNGDK